MRFITLAHKYLLSIESFEYTANSDALGILRLLEAISILNLGNSKQFFIKQLPASYMAKLKLLKQKKLFLSSKSLMLNFIILDNS